MADDRNSGTADRRRDKSQLLEYLQINIDDNEENIKDLKRFTEQEEHPTIYRVPDVFHKMNEGAYTPSIVAIGPLHRGKKHLQAMEGVKLSYMHFLFNRTGNFEKTRDACVDAMLEMESVARRCYADDVRLDEDDKPVKLEYLKSRDVNCCADQNVRFAKMMLIDGCFMIELFYRGFKDENDPILGKNFKQPAVEQDLVLLENQLPFDVLDVLFRLTVERIPEEENCNRPSLTECVLSFYRDEISIEAANLEKKDDDKPAAHLLHLLHSCYLPGNKSEKPEPTDAEIIEAFMNFNYSATELDLGGIKFELHANTNDIFDFKFITTHYSYFCFFRRGQLQIPPILVQDTTELLWRNFIAFEQSCHFMVKSYFWSHAFLMDKLINTAEDVHLFEKKGIIVNTMGSREEVAHLFNNLCNNMSIVPIAPYFPVKDCLEVIDFHKQLWPKFQVKLRRDYFSNPWTVISVVAASFLFVLTLMQTIYTMRS